MLTLYDNPFSPFARKVRLVLALKDVAFRSVDALALAYIAARVVYPALYIMDIGAVRSLSWTVGYGASMALLCSPAWA